MAMGGFSMVHWLIFGVVAVVLFGSRLPNVARLLGRSLREIKQEMCEFEQLVNALHQRQQRIRRRLELPYRLFRLHHEEAMRKLWKKFVWTPKFWAMLGVLGCISGAYFQRVASNGCG